MKNQGGASFITLDDDIYKIKKLTKNGIEIGYEVASDKLIKVSLINSSDEIEVIYHKKIERIKIVINLSRNELRFDGNSFIVV